MVSDKCTLGVIAIWYIYVLLRVLVLTVVVSRVQKCAESNMHN